ncbi:MAG: DUF58 domain-containing protein [Marinoscillum sp.]
MVKTDPYRQLGLRKDLFANIEEFDWLVKALALGEHLGKKSSKRLGAGLEFSQYRPYSQGDDLRQLDWKIYARTDKFYIKQSEIDTNISVTFIPDQSASMRYEENNWSKQSHSKLLIAVLAFLSAENGDKYGVSGIHNQDLGLIPHIGKKHWQRFLNHLITLEESKEFSRPMIPKVQEKELFVVFSDLYEKDHEWLTFIKALKTRRNEVIVFHIMGDQELSFNFTKTTLFRDLESNSEVKIDPAVMKEEYHLKLKQWIEKLREDFRNEGIDYTLINMADPIDQVINKFLWHRKKLI